MRNELTEILINNIVFALWDSLIEHSIISESKYYGILIRSRNMTPSQAAQVMRKTLGGV